MIVRQLERKDKFDAYLISTYCFHSRVDDVEAKRETIENEVTEDWGAFTEDGTLMARIINNKYDFTIDGTPVRTGGIGAVSTLPEYRNTGAVKAIFRKLLPEAYRNGEVLSTLYPFNHSFYRKQGYDTVTYRNEYEFSPVLLECYHTDCLVKMWHPGDSVSEYLEVYNAFAGKCNLSMLRDEKMMADHMKVEALYRDRKFSYLFTKDGKNIAYITFTDVWHDPAAILRVDEFAWLNRDGFEAVLSFLGRFEADYGTVKLSLPTGFDLHRILRTRRAYDVRKTTQFGFMVRVVNVGKLLEVMKKPTDCNITIRVTDEIIAENNGIWHVTADAVSKVDGDGQVPDIEMSERSFAQLAVGAANFDEAMLKPDVEVHANEEMLRRVFTEKKIFINEHF